MLQEPKPLFAERMRKLFNDNEDYEKWIEISKKPLPNSIRCNTLKISPKKLKERLEKRGWIIKHPFREHEEIMIIENELLPGELGRSLEHNLGYYYIQEISSMLPIIALSPKEEDIILDLCASPGSKTTQMAAMMNNKGTIISNDISIGRIRILISNLEKAGATNTIVTMERGIEFCQRLQELGMKFDKILLDAPCSGEGTLRSSKHTFQIWNIKTIKRLGKTQKRLASAAAGILKENGILVYSTCTHAPEENEGIVNFLLENFPFELEKIYLPVKCRPGLQKWNNVDFKDEIKNCCRIYPQDNNTEGFFVAKLRKK